MGEHRASEPRPRAAVPLRLIASLAVLGVVGWFGARYVLDLRHSEPCRAGTATLTIAAAPEIAPILTQVAAAMPQAEREIDGTCVTAQISAIDPAQVLAAQSGKSTASHVDVWVPDSTAWLRRAVDAGANNIPGSGTSIATSPVVIAVAQPTAQKLGWPGKPINWGTLVATQTSPQPLRLAIADPTRSAVGLSGLLSLDATVAPGGKDNVAFAGALRALGANRSPAASDLFAKLPQASDTGSVAAGVAAFPASEQSVINYDLPSPAVPVVPVYPEPPGPALDYPFTVLGGTSDQLTQAANALLAAVQTNQSQALLWHSGFRTASGRIGGGFPKVDGVERTTVAPTGQPDPALSRGLLGLWTTVNLPSRLLAVLDISGSMAEPVPGTNKTRFDLTLQTAQLGLGLFSDDSEVGLWAFSTNLDGTKPYRQLVPIGPLATQRSLILTAEANATVKQGGGTGLYATTLAAYRTVLDGWDKNRSNAVLIITDGQNDDPSGPTLSDTVAQLRSLVDPKRPVRVIFLGVGPDVNLDELKKVAAATHGLAMLATDPSKLSEVFLQALAERPCQTATC